MKNKQNSKNIVDITAESIGKGFQILGATKLKKAKKVTLLEALKNDKKGFEKWISIIMNGLALIVFIIIIISIIYSFVDFLYNIL